MSKAVKQVDPKEPERVEAQNRPTFVPETDIYEKDDLVLVRCDMPGVAEKDVDITLENQVLTITGVQSSGAPEGYDLLAGEYESGVFQRAFKISHDVDRDKIKARMKDGVLDIELPKSAKAQPRKIAVEVA